MILFRDYSKIKEGNNTKSNLFCCVLNNIGFHVEGKQKNKAFTKSTIM